LFSKARKGIAIVRPEPPAPIQWRCNDCDDEGIVSSWEDSPYDLRRWRLTVAGDVNEIVISDKTAAALRELTLLDPVCERLVCSACVPTVAARCCQSPTTTWMSSSDSLPPKPTMSPTAAASSDSTPHSRL